MDRPALSDAVPLAAPRALGAGARLFRARRSRCSRPPSRAGATCRAPASEVTASQGRRHALRRRPRARVASARSRARDSMLRSPARDEGLRCVVVLGAMAMPPLATGDCPRPPAAFQERLAASRPGTVLESTASSPLASDPPPPPGHPPRPPGVGTSRAGRARWSATRRDRHPIRSARTRRSARRAAALVSSAAGPGRSSATRAPADRLRAARGERAPPVRARAAWRSRSSRCWR